MIRSERFYTRPENRVTPEQLPTLRHSSWGGVCDATCRACALQKDTFKTDVEKKFENLQWGPNGKCMIKGGDLYVDIISGKYTPER